MYICRSLGLSEVANYWEQVILLNDYQKRRFADNIITTMYNTVSDKKIAFLGWAFKKDTNDTRETPAMYIADQLIEDHACIHAYDPKVTERQMHEDINYLNTRTESENDERLIVENDPYQAVYDAHAVAVLTEWEEFKDYNWKKIYDNMKKPAFVFDGRKILDIEKLKDLGFKVYQIGKSMD